MLKKDLKTTYFSLLMSVLNFLLFHFPFFAFISENVNGHSFNGVLIFSSLVVLVLVANFLFFYIVTSISRFVGKPLLVFFFMSNAIAFYFVASYNVIIDESMIGNVFNTNYEESASFFSFKLLLYVLLFGLLPSIYVVKVKLVKETWKRFTVTTSVALITILVLVFANAGNWLWIDKHSKVLGGLVMPWSYTVNASLYQIHKSRQNKKEILLPDATIKDDEKSVFVLVIGESARSCNFSLYGYGKNTNPLLSKTENLHCFESNSCTTYTTASLKCILEHKETGDLYEILPNYLYRNHVDVVWRTTNWGEPPVHIADYHTKEDLMSSCQGDGCGYDEILLTGLKERIAESGNNKILIVLHTGTSHGPTYSKKYPPQFEVFKPVCNSVELSECSHEELINAYDNTIVYTDYLLHRVIEDLKQLPQYKSAMLFVSDHGESLGEGNLYMHGVPLSIAPKEQYEIPFIVWTSDGARPLKPNKTLSQHHVFHSVLKFLGIQSPIYDEEMNIFE